MKIRQIQIHNFRSIVDATIETSDYTLLVGANNAGKSNVMNALRVFYEDLKWTPEDFPKAGATDDEAWISLSFALTEEEWAGLAEKYKDGQQNRVLTVRKYLKSADRVKASQSNIYAIVNGEPEKDLFYGAKNISNAKVGSVVYIPALTTPSEQMKMSGPSPLRNMLQFMLKKLIAKSPAYEALGVAFEQLNQEARKSDGFLTQISTPINEAITSWGIKLDLAVNPVNPDDITKSLIKHAFIDGALGDASFDLDKYGHGFQRSVIYELIRIAPTFKDHQIPTKKEFNPDFTLVLFEEPEAFLHPSQQENMAFHLRRLGSASEQQVIITTHSAVFVGKACDDLAQIARVQRCNGASQIYQPTRQKIESIFQAGSGLLTALKEYVEREDVPEANKKKARELIAAPPPAEDISLQEERFRQQLWLDGERASMFFANKVLLVEGASERALFNYLLANGWSDLTSHRVFVVEVFGKFNFHRFMALLEAFGIPHGVMLDDDYDNNHHVAINAFIEQCSNKYTAAAPFKFKGCTEAFLGLEVPRREERKPIEMLKAISNKEAIAEEKLIELRKAFCNALAIQDNMFNSASSVETKLSLNDAGIAKIEAAEVGP